MIVAETQEKPPTPKFINGLIFPCPIGDDFRSAGRLAYLKPTKKLKMKRKYLLSIQSILH